MGRKYDSYRLYGSNLGTDIDIALKQLGLHGKKLISTSNSTDPSNNKNSPINPFKGYPK